MGKIFNNKKPTIKTSTLASIGLLRVGEMFTSGISRRIRANFWTLTHCNEINVWLAYVPGLLENYVNSNETNGAFPSVYLKSTVKIASNNTG